MSILQLQAEHLSVNQDKQVGLKASPPTGGLIPIDNALLRGVKVSLDAILGRGAMTAEVLMALAPGAIVKLDSSLADQVELYLNDALVARGEIVAVGDHYGVRIVEVAPPA